MDPVVVGTDGSATATRAVTRAGELAAALGAPLHIVMCCENHSTATWATAAAGVAVAMAPDASEQAEAQKVLARAQRELDGIGVATYTHVVSGEPAEALLAIAEDERAQMIVVGNRGMKGARRVLGSVPNSVSHRARCAVVIVPTCD
jgi:nucleotide-binding universal stress UspA family protein